MNEMSETKIVYFEDRCIVYEKNVRVFESVEEEAFLLYEMVTNPEIPRERYFSPYDMLLIAERF